MMHEVSDVVCVCACVQGGVHQCISRQSSTLAPMHAWQRGRVMVCVVLLG
jgi:hypothetical protein